MTMNKQTISYTLLAKSIPEFDKRDGKLYTCSLGYFEQLGFIRVYPLPIVGMKKWHTYKITVEKNKRDSRKASWKLASYSRKNNWVGFTDDVKLLSKPSQIKKDKLTRLMCNYISPSISALNKNRQSIGFIRADSLNPFWEANDRYINTCQIGMFDDVELADFTKYTKEQREKIARVVFKDGDGKHNLQLNEWQYTEYQRRFGATKDAFRYITGNSPKVLMLGNMLQFQSSWMVLSVFKLKQSIAQPLLFS